ncbi:MAG: hypothetical protein ACLFVQ_13685 [Chitinispirillaceae bacterium]
MILRNFFIVIAAAALLIPANLSARNIVFLGLSGPEAASIEESLEPKLRSRLSTMRDFKTADFIKSQQYKDKISFDRYPVVSEALVRKLEAIAPDSAIFVWGTVKEYQIQPKRHLLLGARIEGKLTINYTMYNLAERSYAYSGEVKADAVRGKGIVLFRPVDQAVHITALDRIELLEELENEITEGSASLISIVARSAKFSSKTEESDQEVEKYKVPSVEDVYKVPEIDAPENSSKEEIRERLDSTAEEK